MVMLPGFHRRIPGHSQDRCIRNAFTLFMIFSAVILTVFSLLAGSTVFANLGSWKPSVVSCLALVFAILSYKGADTAMFGACVTAYFVSLTSRTRKVQQGESRNEAWRLQRCLHRFRARALAISAVALSAG